MKHILLPNIHGIGASVGETRVEKGAETHKNTLPQPLEAVAPSHANVVETTQEIKRDDLSPTSCLKEKLPTHHR
ncbi:MAG: hypothetical protein CL920_20560 [Deltaproteobacteria bacterium]|nr:hypothetical protein [Deltaproteobacteria bacterium]MBU51086.1 hypothetical protein [Deltaproteobacteria bacterium]